MDPPRHDGAHPAAVPLRAHEHMLCAFGEAAMLVDGRAPFAFECFTSYPYVWVRHPGFDRSPIVAAFGHLQALDRLGYITLRFRDRAQTGSFALTPAGLARCA